MAVILHLPEWKQPRSPSPTPGCRQSNFIDHFAGDGRPPRCISSGGGGCEEMSAGCGDLERIPGEAAADASRKFRGRLTVGRDEGDSETEGTWTSAQLA